MFSQNYFSINVDNDLFFGTDRYYSSGIFLNFGNKVSIDSLSSNNKIITRDFVLGQKINTPSYRYTKDIKKIDYPYNGWLFVQYKMKTFYSYYKGYSVGFQLGTTGENESLSKPMQNLYHKYILDLPPLPWVNHQPQSFHFDFITEYYNGLKFNNNINLLSHSELYLGTYESYFGTRLGFQFGKINHHVFYNNSFLNPDKSISFYLGSKIEYSFHRYSFSGSLFDSNSLFKYDYLKMTHKIELGLLYNINDWQFTTIINSKGRDFEVQRYNRHTYLTIIILKTF